MSSLITAANSYYKSGNFEKALETYKNASKVFGEHLFTYHIKKCLQKLEASNDTASPNLDPTTEYLLAKRDGIIRTDLEKALAGFSSFESEDAPVKKVNPIPSDWPEGLELRALPESTNDYVWWDKNRLSYGHKQESYEGLSIIIPTFNRSNILRITLACLVNQETEKDFEVIVADDGSSEDIGIVVREFEGLLDIKHVRQADRGYQLCAARNLGIRTAKYQAISILDCDMAPDTAWVESFITAIESNDDIAYIGPRKYVDTSSIDKNEIINNRALISSLPEVVTNNKVAGKTEGTISVDWRLEHFQKTDNLRLCNSPFRFFSGGNVAFSKKWIDKAGWFDEEFTHWGGEDNEFGYRLYRAGCFFKNLDGGMAYHQEPPGKENETDRVAGKLVTSEQVYQKVPYIYRKIVDYKDAQIFEKPLVSIYIPTYNAEDTILRCVHSALNQSITDLEVCICDDGSTDNTLEILKRNFSSHPRVKFTSRKNGGIGAASNSALELCSGFYIGQLDSDDTLNPDAVRVCLRELTKDHSLISVYTTNNNIYSKDNTVAPGYNWPLYSREKLSTAMIYHHFRMFTRRSFGLTGGFDESIENAVDYDFYLKVSELGKIKHINKTCYNRYLHGENTSIKKLKEQKDNHFISIKKSLFRQKIYNYNIEPADKDKSSRKHQFTTE